MDEQSLELQMRMVVVQICQEYDKNYGFLLFPGFRIPQ